MGGLGFKDFEAFNIALLAKQFWRLIDCPNSLWARVLKGLYFPNKSWKEAVRGPKPSWLWTSLLEGRKLIMDGVQWNVGNGESIQFWNDSWVPSISGGKVSPIHPDVDDRTMVSQFINPITKRWDEGQLKLCIPINQVQEVSKIPISISGARDRLIWRDTKTGVYTVKSGYAHQRVKNHASKFSKPSCSFTPSTLMWKKFWNIPTLPKIRIFMWKVIKNWTACKANLVRRKCGSNPTCPICESANETMEHLLFHCPWSRAVWFGSNKAYWVFQKDIGAVDKWMEDLLCGDLAKETRREDLGEILQICWAIWKARNRFVFENCPLKPEEVIEHALKANKDYLFAVCSGSNNTFPRQVGALKWVPPASSCVKINLDGAFNSSRGLAAFGVIARDSGGLAQWWNYGKVLVTSPLAIEAWALRIACVMAEERNIDRAIFESDCKHLVDLLVDSKLECPWEIATIVDDIKAWASRRQWTFTWCRRECNKAAHWIASNCLARRSLFHTGCIPPALESLLSKDLS